MLKRMFKKMLKLKVEDGHMYLEAIIAMLFLGLVFPVLLALVVQTQKLSAFAGSTTVATNLAKERLEYFKRFERVDDAHDRSHNCWKPGDRDVLVNGKLYKVTSELIQNKNIPDKDIATNPDIIPIEVKVTWQAGEETRSVKMASYFLKKK